jgi:hypothetical protein
MTRFWTVLFVAALAAGCAETMTDDLDGSVVPDSDASETCKDVKGDADADGISNGDEGCLSGRDSDKDGIADWEDTDSDDDGIPDSVEAGEKTAGGKCKGAKSGSDAWPCDSDGDGVPDVRDLDSDNDGVKDEEEDLNGDGLVGCCLQSCNKPGSVVQQKCVLNAEGCGGGQKCVSGTCTPAAAFLCSKGETSTTAKDTFGDGILDDKRGTFICRDATEDKPEGRKPVQLRSDTKGDWKIAIEVGAKYGPLTVASGSGQTAAAVIDHDDTGAEVAGFVVSKSSSKPIQEELKDLLAAITTNPPGGAGTVTVRASGTQGKSHDRYDSVSGTYLDLKISGSSSNVSTVRNELVARLLGVSTAGLSNLPAPYGSSHSELILRFTTVKRFEFKKDKDGDLVDKDGKKVKDSGGDPIDSGDSSKWQLLVMGAVAGGANYADPKRKTGLLVDDLSGGTALALSGDKVGNECDAGEIANIPRADIVWVSDESGSMNDNRDDVVANATEFFKRAIAMGLDFRMGITNVVPKSQVGFGKFCSKTTTNKNDDGGVDRFLLPSEQTIFTSCIRNPPGYTGGHSPGEYGLINAEEAFKIHLPRSSNAANKFRPDAAIVFVILTDQMAAAIEGPMGMGNAYSCTLPATVQSQVDVIMQKYIDLFTGVTLGPGTALSRFLVLGGVCNNTCKAMISHGYGKLTQILGGHIADVCQKKLGPTLQVFLDSIVGSASPVKLDHVPIASSLAVAIDGSVIKRDRANGFDYNAGKNSLVFINVAYKKGSQVFVSYKRWERQLTIQ